MINFLTYATFFLFSLGQLGRISLNEGQINFYLYEIVAVILFIVLFLKLKFLPIKKTFNKLRIVYYFFSFLIISNLLGSFNYSLEQNVVSLLYLLRLIFYFVFPLYLYFSKNRIRGFTVFAFLIIIFSTIQYLFYPNLRNLFYLGWDPHFNRLFSVFFDTSTAAAVFGLMFFYFYKNKRYWLALPFLIFLILTFSRSAYLFFGLTLLVDVIIRRKIRIGLVVLLLAASIFLLAPKQFGFGVGLDRIFSISSRLNDYQKGIAMWQKSPIIGHGYNRLAYVKEKMNLQEAPKENFPIHSAASLSGSFLIILVTLGAVGLVLFIASLLRLIELNKSTTVYFLFLGLMSLPDNILLHPFILFLFGVIYVVSLPSDKLPLKRS